MKNARGSARRYAEAAFQIADQDGTLDVWLKDLDLAAALLEPPDVQRLLANPAIPIPVRADAVGQALGTRVSEKARNLVLLLMRRGRVDLVGAVAAAYRAEYERRNGIVRATVISATPLDAAEQAAIRQRLGQMVGSTLEIEQHVDPAILGGVIVRLGDRMIDGSVRGRLERLRSRLEAGVI